MKKHLLIGLAIVIGIAVFAISLQTKQDTTTTVPTEPGIQVSATIPPIGMIAEAIIGEAGTVHTVLAAGMSPHTFEPTPQDIRNVGDSTVIFSVGHELDSWITNITSATNNSEPVVVDANIALRMYEGHDHHEDEHHEEEGDHHDEDGHEGEEHEEEKVVDPHYWLSPTNAKSIAMTIRDTMQAVDPEQSSTYESNYTAFITALEEAEVTWNEQLERVAGKSIITFHDAWGYFAAYTGISVAATIEPFPGQQPTPQYLAELQDTIQDTDVTAVFTEPQLASDTISAFISDTGATYGIFDPLGGQEETNTYIALMNYNVATLVAQLQ